MNKVYLLLGGNLGDRKKNLSSAKEHIIKTIGKVMKHSSIYETEAWGMKDQPAFLNCVLQIETEKNPRQILEKILDIEKKMGRKREAKWGSRIIDIDILFFDQDVVSEDDLVIPHPFIHERRFTLVPLAEIAGEFVHPIFGKTINELLLDCTDVLKTRKIEI